MMDVQRIRRERFERLFVQHYADVLGYALRRAPRALAEDVASEAFLVAWRRLEAVPEDALPWLLGVARRTLANQRRSHARSDALISRLGDEALAQGRPAGDRLSGDPDGRLAEALRALSEREREAVLLVAWEGLRPTQAAQVVGCSSTAFRLRLHRARKRLSDEFGASCVAVDQERPADPTATTTGNA
jgi:RNA polymerase sigma factor (sigma-70 family)